MSGLVAFLNTDEMNTKISCHNINAAESCSTDAIDACAGALDAISQAYGNQCDYVEHQKRIAALTGKVDGSGDALLILLEEAHLVGKFDGLDLFKDAKESLVGSMAALSRMMLGLRLRREFFFGISDLLRLRISSAMGVLRVQAETAAAAWLIYDKPELGDLWMKTIDDQTALKFHRNHHSSIVERIRNLGVYHDYQRGSNMALHTRASGIALGYLLGKPATENKGNIELIYQEAKDARVLYFWFAIYMRFHRRIVDQASQLFPEIEEEKSHHKAVELFRTKEDKVWLKAKEFSEAKGENRLSHLMSG